MSAGIVTPCPGVAIYRVKKDDGGATGAVVMPIHYTADKAKRDPLWAEAESQRYVGATQSPEWLQEYELDLDAEKRLRTFWAFDERRNTCEAFPVPYDWPKRLAFDFGNKTGCIFTATDPITKRVYVFDEGYWERTPTGDIKAQIYDKLAGHAGHEITPITLDAFIQDSVGDPSGAVSALEYGQEPFPIWIRTKGHDTPWRINDLVMGEARVNQALAPSFFCCGRLRFPPGLDEAGICRVCLKEREARPILQIMKGRAPNLVRTLPKILKKATTAERPEPEDKDAPGQEDHLADCLRYSLAAEIWEPPDSEKEVDLMNTPIYRLRPEQLMARHIREAAMIQEKERLVEDDEATLYFDDLLEDLGVVQDSGGYYGDDLD